MPDIEYFHYKYKFPKALSRSSKTIDRKNNALLHPFPLKYDNGEIPEGNKTSEDLFGPQPYDFSNLLGYFIKIIPIVIPAANSSLLPLITYKLEYKKLFLEHLTKNNGYDLFKNVGKFEELINQQKVLAGNFKNTREKTDIVQEVFLENPGFALRRVPRSIIKHNDLRFQFQNKTIYKSAENDSYGGSTSIEPKMKVDKFDLCYVSKSDLRYIMNEIIMNPDQDGYLFISGGKINTGDLIGDKNKTEKPRNEYFTLKFETYQEPSHTARDVRNYADSPRIYLSSPCPPIWRPNLQALAHMSGLPENEVIASSEKFKQDIADDYDIEQWSRKEKFPK